MARSKIKKAEEPLIKDSDKKRKKKESVSDIKDVPKLKPNSKNGKTKEAPLNKTQQKATIVKNQQGSSSKQKKEPAIVKNPKGNQHIQKKVASPIKSSKAAVISKNSMVAPPRQKKNAPTKAIPNNGIPKTGKSSTGSPVVRSAPSSKKNKGSTAKDDGEVLRNKKSKVTMASSSKQTGDAINNSVTKKIKLPMTGIEDLIRIIEKIERGIQKNNQLLKTLIDSTAATVQVNTALPASHVIATATSNVTTAGTIPTDNTTTITPVATDNVISANITAPTISKGRIGFSTPVKTGATTLAHPIKSMDKDPPQKIVRLPTPTNNTPVATTDKPKTLPAAKVSKQPKTSTIKPEAVNRVAQRSNQKPNCLPVLKSTKTKDNKSHMELNQPLISYQPTLTADVNTVKNQTVTDKSTDRPSTLTNKDDKVLTSFSFKVFFKKTEEEKTIRDKINRVTTYINSYLGNKAFMDSVNKDLETTSDILPIQLDTFRDTVEDAWYFKFNVYSNSINDTNLGRVIENIQEKFFKWEDMGLFKCFVYAL